MIMKNIYNLTKKEIFEEYETSENGLKNDNKTALSLFTQLSSLTHTLISSTLLLKNNQIWSRNKIMN